MSRSINKGVDVYNIWHSKDPSSIKSIKFSMPDVVRRVGKGVMIAYRSSKWEKSGKTHDYEHELTSGPSVYHEFGDGREKMVSSMLKSTSPSDVNPSGSPVLIELGKCIELILSEPGSDELSEISMSGNPKLCCTTDMKTLVILHKDGPIFINGGKTKVTSRGIVD